MGLSDTELTDYMYIYICLVFVFNVVLLFLYGIFESLISILGFNFYILIFVINFVPLRL